MKKIVLAVGLALLASNAYADRLASGLKIEQVSNSVFMLGEAPVEEKAEENTQSKPREVVLVPTADMTLDEIVGPRPEVMNAPRTLADIKVPSKGEDDAGQMDTASSVSMPNADGADKSDAAVEDQQVVEDENTPMVDKEETASVPLSEPPTFDGVELRRE